MNKKKKFWFVAKNYGWGWMPYTWQGWVAILIYVVGVFAIFSRLNGKLPEDVNMTKEVVLPFAILTIFLVIVSYKKGEKPEWRWGGKPLKK